MILKLLLVIGVIAIVYFIFFKKKPLRKSSSSKKDERLESNDMVECASCGVYCELDEAILSNAKYFCCDECVENQR